MSTERRVLTTVDLPPDLAERFRRTADLEERPATLAEAVTAVERLLAGVEIPVDRLYQPEPTRHAVHLAESVEHVPCVLDALIVAELVEERPVEIRSDPPVGDGTVRFRVTDGVDVDPTTAVVSFGLAAEDAADPDLESLEAETTISPATCSYINAFPDPDAYGRWEEGVSDAVVMELPVEAAVAFADRAADGWVASRDV